MKNQISAKIVADSINQQGDRITTMEVVFPRFILAEFNTHRLFTRNSASSRAIPFKKMLRMVRNTPFIPIAWQKDHSGMQGTEYFEGWRAKLITIGWKLGSKLAIFASIILNKLGLTKQLCNRLLEPFMYHKVLVTFTESENFFNLRCPNYHFINTGQEYFFKSKKYAINYFGDNETIDSLDNKQSLKQLSELDWLKVNKGQGEIHIMDLAEKMWDALKESIPVKLKAGEWHIPYGENINLLGDNFPYGVEDAELKISIARCARLSYQTLGDNPKIDYEADLKLFNILKDSGHFSPFEHVARCMSDDEYEEYVKGQACVDIDDVDWGDNIGFTKVRNIRLKGGKSKYTEPNEDIQGWCGNFKGFIQYRYMLES